MPNGARSLPVVVGVAVVTESWGVASVGSDVLIWLFWVG